MPTKPNTADDKLKGSDNAQSTVAAANTEKQKQNPEVTADRFEQQKPIPDRSEIERQTIEWTAVVGRWTRLVAVFTGLLVAVTAGTIWVAIQADETQRSAQRPWVEIASLEIVSPITCERGVGKTRVKIQLRNSGNSPACWMLSPNWQSRSMSEHLSNASQQKICKPLADAPVDQTNPGRRVFPEWTTPKKKLISPLVPPDLALG